jgi:sedoheptulokinase
MKAIGIDIGTTSVCAVLIDVESGKLIKSCTKNSDAFINTANPWEKIQSVEKIMFVAMELVDDFIDADVKAIGVTGQMHGIVYTDKNGDAVSPLYIWQDGRGNLPYKDTTYAKYLNSFSGYGNVTDFYNRVNGIRPDDAVNYCTIHDYFVMKLCGLKSPVLHSSDASSFGLYNIKANKFMCDFNAEVVNDYAVAGEYKGIKVAVAIGDNQASVFSTLADEENILLNIGTGSQISVVSDNIIEKENIETRPYFEGKYLIVGAALCGGRAYSILKNFYKEILSYIEDADDEKVYSVMGEMLKDTSHTALKVDTRFDGTRTNPDLRGSIDAISIDNFRPGDFTLGVLNGMVTELYDMYMLMDVTKSGIVGSGNGVRKNKALINAFEGRFDAKMKIPMHLEEAAFGASLFALISSGVFKNAKEAQKLIKYN